MRFRLRSTVLLPQPDGPMKPVILPFLDRHVAVAHRQEITVVDLSSLQSITTWVPAR